MISYWSVSDRAIQERREKELVGMLPSFWTQRELRASVRLRTALRRKFGHVELSRLERAMDFAVQNHSGQTRKGTDAPYSVHPIRVALSLIEELNQTDSDVICAAILH